jgi:hypothetical protein
MSKIIGETEEHIKLVDYLHRDPDSFSAWELDSEGNTRYPEMIHEAEHFALYEVEVQYFINKKTGEVTIDSFNST